MFLAWHGPSHQSPEYDPVNPARSAGSVPLGEKAMHLKGVPDPVPRPLSGQSPMGNVGLVEVTMRNATCSSTWWNSIFIIGILLMLMFGCGHDGVSGPDVTPPAAVTDLTVGASTQTSLILTWTAPGDNGMMGRATEYDIRYSTSSGAEWDTMTQVSGEPRPKEAGQSEGFDVSGLTPGTTYYFQMKTRDEGNWSGVSNMPSGTTDPFICVDDGYEENDTRATAYDWSSGEGIPIFAQQDDDDWYRISLSALRVLVNCRFTHAEGDIDIQLVNSSGTVVAQSTSNTDNEHIDFIAPSFDIYYIRVYMGDQCNRYRLSWDDVGP